MTNKPKAIGTAGETAVVRYLNANGFGGAERVALKGIADEGDIGVCPGVMCEVKAGHAAEQASDTQIAAWLDDTERERVARGADVAFLVLKRKGKGAANAGAWWAFLPGWTYTTLVLEWARLPLIYGSEPYAVPAPAVQLRLADAVHLLRAAGYGDAIDYTLTDKDIVA